MNLHNLHEKAIEEALRGNFRKAVELNTQIIAQDPVNLDAYLRLGFAFFQINNFRLAKKYYQKALRVESTNQIAKTNLDKIKILEKKGLSKEKEKDSLPLDPTLFLVTPGKTKVINLVNLGQVNILAKLKAGQKVVFKIKKRRVELRNQKNEYIGSLPDDISKRLIFFIEGKSEYTMYIKEASKNHIYVFIKEEKKGVRVAKYTSFSRNIKDDLKSLHEEHDDTEKEEETDEHEKKHEEPVDLEEIAQQVEEKAYFHNPEFEEEKEEE